jgi:hypothetical protein
MTVAVLEVEEAPRPTARLARYAIWQLRDYVFGVGGATLLISVLTMGVITAAWIGDRRAVGPGLPGVVLSLLGFLGPIFATSGLVADDRSKGYYRFAFAKPVSPVRFYGQAYVLRGLVLLVITALVWALGAVLSREVSLFGALGYTAVCYVGVGGVTLLLSAMLRNAWLASLVLGAASAIAASVNLTVRGPLWAKAIHLLLPPYFLAGRMVTWLVDGAHLTDAVLGAAWFVGYGALALGAALAVIRGREWPL